MKRLFGWLLVLSVIGAVVYYLYGCREKAQAAESWGGD
jgi:hypothetical protein